jgi:tuberous sclerosis protein 2
MLSVETHKLGVLDVREGQRSQNDILSNSTGSPLYLRFLRLLGDIVRLGEIPDGTYTAGLDRSSEALDGEYSLMWSNESTQVMFHVATMMPTVKSDPACTAKKKHVGNDYVHIVFDESGALSYDLDTVTGQFTVAVINVVPLDKGMYRVSVTRKPHISQFGPLLPSQIVPESQLGELVRQTAINGNIACLMHQEERGIQFVSHSEERLAQLKQIVERFGKTLK